MSCLTRTIVSENAMINVNKYGNNRTRMKVMIMVMISFFLSTAVCIIFNIQACWPTCVYVRMWFCSALCPA